MSASISYNDFSNNFIVHIRSIEHNHTDETGTYDYGVGFNVVCKLNNRVMYFENHLNANTLPQNFTEQDIVNTAWSNLKSSVKTWATTAFSLPSLLDSTWVPPSNLSFSPIDDFTLNVYNSNFTTKVARFEVYPPTDPKSWCVGFTIINNNNNEHGLYIDTNIIVNTFAVTKAEEEILELAWSNLKEQIGLWAKNKYDISNLINTVYTAPSNNW